MNATALWPSNVLGSILCMIALCSVASSSGVAQPGSEKARRSTAALEHMLSGLDNQYAQQIDSLTPPFRRTVAQTIAEAHPAEMATLRREWLESDPYINPAKEITSELTYAQEIAPLVIRARALLTLHPELRGELDRILSMATLKALDWEIAQLNTMAQRTKDTASRNLITMKLRSLEAQAADRHQFQLRMRTTLQRWLPSMILDSGVAVPRTMQRIELADALPYDSPRQDSVRRLLGSEIIRMQEDYWNPRLTYYTERANALLSRADRAKLQTLRAMADPSYFTISQESDALIAATRAIAASNRAGLGPLRDSILHDIAIFTRWYPEQFAAMLEQYQDTLANGRIGTELDDLAIEIAFQGSMINSEEMRKDYPDRIEPALLLYPPHKLLRSGALSVLTHIVREIEMQQ